MGRFVSATSPEDHAPQPGDGGVRGVPPPSNGAALLVRPGSSGTVGVLTGTTGGRMGMGPSPGPEGRRSRRGLEDGVRRMVATPGVLKEGAGPGGGPGVEEVGGLLEVKRRRWEGPWGMEASASWSTTTE